MIFGPYTEEKPIEERIGNHRLNGFEGNHKTIAIQKKMERTKTGGKVSCRLFFPVVFC